MDYLKELNAIFFSREEIFDLVKISKMPELLAELGRRSLELRDLRSNPLVMTQITEGPALAMADDRDEHEVLVALDTARFYGQGSKIGFEMQPGFDPDRDKIRTLGDLNRMREGSPSDFIILTSEGAREFQLKRYREGLSTQEVFDFLVTQIGKYGNDLGDMNLMVILQPSENNLSRVSFKDLHNRLHEKSFVFKGWIMISYNENNEFSVIETVYPILGTTRIPLQLPSAMNLGK